MLLRGCKNHAHGKSPQNPTIKNIPSNTISFRVAPRKARNGKPGKQPAMDATLDCLLDPSFS
jgi:hypothetical protein